MNVALDPNFAPTTQNDGARFAKVDQLLESAIEDGVFPGAVVVAGQNGQELYKRAVGLKWLKGTNIPLNNQVSQENIFDVASLTSSVVTTTLIMLLVQQGRVQLSDKVSRYLDGFSVFGKSQINIAHLLSHSSGLPAWMPYFEEILRANSTTHLGMITSRGARDYIITSIKRSQLKFEPGSKQIYSDLGLITLGFLIELLTGLSLERAAIQYVFQPFNLKNTSFIDLSRIKRRGIHPVKDLIAPTEECPWRKRIVCGEVHDDNAWAMGGIAGHSGLFTNANDLFSFASQLVVAYRGQSTVLAKDVLHGFWHAFERGSEDDLWQYGWDTPGKENGLAEVGLSKLAVGMCGFTGCSLWIEPRDGTVIVLMSNRVHPTRSNRKMRTFRSALHEAILASLR